MAQDISEISFTLNDRNPLLSILNLTGSNKSITLTTPIFGSINISIGNIINTNICFCMEKELKHWNDISRREKTILWPRLSVRIEEPFIFIRKLSDNTYVFYDTRKLSLRELCFIPTLFWKNYGQLRESLPNNIINELRVEYKTINSSFSYFQLKGGRVLVLTSLCCYPCSNRPKYYSHSTENGRILNSVVNFVPDTDN